MRSYRTRIFFLVFLSLSSWAYSAQIKLKTGQVVDCKILKQETDSVLVDVGLGTPVTYFSDEIKEIIPDNAGLPASGRKLVPTLKQQADKIEDQAVELIDHDKMEEGLKLMKSALDLDPSPMRHMNYGSILFGNGVADFKAGKVSDANEILHQAEDQLNQAIAGFNPQREGVFMAQAYFLLGEIYANAFSDPDKAKTLYTKALSYYENEGAKAALEKLK